jgi:hypothetical protein
MHFEDAKVIEATVQNCFLFWMNAQQRSGVVKADMHHWLVQNHYTQLVQTLA